jgi:DNA-directed RNA polymerase subunit N (RpoN/RPB10)
MGPLIICTSCGNELHIEYTLFSEIRMRKLQSVEMKELLSSTEGQLLANETEEFFEKLRLPVCCRMCLASHEDYTPKIYT